MKYSFTRHSAMERQLNNIERQLYHIQYQLTNISILLRSPDQQLLDNLADRRRAALERYRVKWEQTAPVSCCRRRSEDGEDEID